MGSTTATPCWSPTRAPPGRPDRARSIAAADLRVGLAALVNQYIGETEKNIGTLFAQAERNRAVLVYDEATALFGDDRP